MGGLEPKDGIEAVHFISPRREIYWLFLMNMVGFSPNRWMAGTAYVTAAA